MYDIDICEKIFGPDIYTLKGNTVQNKPKEVVNYYIGIPQWLKDTYQNIEKKSNIMYIQGKIFLVNISKNIKFITIQDITDSNIPILDQ